MVQLHVRCPYEGTCDKKWHVRHIDADPHETALLVHALTYAQELGVSWAMVRVPHVGQIGGITKNGFIWAINPN